MPTFLTSVLHAGPAALGAIEGVSDALTGLAKLAGGPLAADPRRRARIASGGYLATAVATAADKIATETRLSKGRVAQPAREARARKL